MRVLLLNPSPAGDVELIRSYSGGYGDVIPRKLGCERDILFPPLELLRLAAVLRAAACIPTVVDRQGHPDQSLPEESDAVVVTCSLPTLSDDCTVLRHCADRYPGARRFLFTSIRHQPVWKKMLDTSRADGILLPEAIPQAADVLGGRARAGVVWADGDARHVNIADKTVWPSPDEEPLPARDLLDHAPYVFSPLAETHAPARPITTAHSSYGCPYPCGYYCPYPAAEGRQFRAHSPDRVVAELRQAALLGIGAVVFRDPIFTFQRERVQAICAGIMQDNLCVPWWCETRLDLVDEGLLAEMASAGCVGLEVGVESGDEALLAGAARKGITLDEVRRFHRHATALGLCAHYLFIVGLPTQTRDSVARTLEFVLDLGVAPGRFNLSTITPYPGTQLYSDARDSGWIEKEWDQFTGYSSVMRTDRLSAAAIAEGLRFGRLLEELLAHQRRQPRHDWDLRRSEFEAALGEWCAEGGA
jgi:radical SAM superfamily enzyme YgiQ (UPF0313 family)